jgi:amidase
MVAIVPGSCESRSVVERSAVWMARAVREREVSAVEPFVAHATRVAERDAEVIRGMRGAGAILLGKTNVSEFLSWWDSVSLLFGATANPHDRSRTAGGSSGGEAAALASEMSPLGLGSDLGGSIRNPWHFVGVFGLKPGRDTVPFADHAPLPPGPGFRLMGVVGPMARYVEDAGG